MLWSLQGQDVQVVVWLLRHRLIYQVHTFVHLIPKDHQYRPRVRSTKDVEEENEDEEMEGGKDADIKQPSKLLFGQRFNDRRFLCS